MLVVRIIGLAAAALIGFAVLAWLLTGERRWLRIAWYVFIVALCAVLVFLLLLAGEHLVDSF